MKTAAFLFTAFLSLCCTPPQSQKEAAPRAPDGKTSSADGKTSRLAMSSSPAPKVEAPQLCGNGSTDAAESCDDGNRAGGDGCSPNCRLEAVGFQHSRAIDMAGAMHSLPDASPLSEKAHPAVARFEHATVLLKGSPPALMKGSPPYYLLPDTFDGQVEHFAGLGDVFNVALNNGEVWGMVTHLNQDTVCRELHLEEPGLVAQDGKRWCKWPRKSKRVVDLTIDCLVEEGGDLKCPTNNTRSRLHKVPLPPVASFSESATFCAVLQTGEVACWGYGRYGQLGYVAPGTGVDDEPVQHTPPKTFLKFKTPVKKLIAGDRTMALTEGGELWCWGDCGELPFADTGEPESYWDRMCAESPPKPGSPPKPVGASTMPSAPLRLPEGCVPKDFAWSCVLCEDGCTKCWRDKESLEKAECITY